MRQGRGGCTVEDLQLLGIRLFLEVNIGSWQPVPAPSYRDRVLVKRLDHNRHR
jgi:hypothetical protein